jgi:hypothetical protein
MTTGKLQREITQYKKMLSTLNPSKNLSVNTNPINQALSQVNIIKKRGGESGHQRLVDGTVIPIKQTLMRQKLAEMNSRNANRSHSSSAMNHHDRERPHLPFDAIEALADYDANMTL